MNYNIVSEDTGNAFCEVYDIINNMENELQNKIPKTFVNFIKVISSSSDSSLISLHQR